MEQFGSTERQLPGDAQGAQNNVGRVITPRPSHQVHAFSRSLRNVLPGVALSLTFLAGVALRSQTSAPASSPAGARQSGTVKAATDHDFVLTDTGGKDHAINLPASTRVLIVPPGSKDLSAAAPGSISDLQPGDHVLVNTKPGDSGPALTASRVVIMKSAAIEQTHAADQAAWARGTGGLVKAVDSAAGSISITSAGKPLMIATSSSTAFRRYAGGSVRFEDATRSTLASVAPGDQLRARGTRSPDGTSLQADEVVTGSFHNYSGVIASVDATANTVTLKDLASKKTVTIALSDQSNVRRLPPEIAARFAQRERGASGTSSPGGSATPGRTPGQGGNSASPTSASPTSATPSASVPRERSGSGAYSAARPAGSGETASGDASPRGASAGSAGGAGRIGLDLSAMLGRLPTETLGGLKTGEAVMIVASLGADAAARPTVITLLAGVEPILSASPNGEGATLSPWNVGGGGGGEGEAGGGPQ